MITNKQEKQEMIGKQLGQSKNDYGDSAGIVHVLFLAPKIENCIVVNKIGVISQTITFKGCDQDITRVGFKDFLDLQKSKTVRKMSKLNWKRESKGAKIPHRVIDCEVCRTDVKCQSCFKDPKMNSLEDELCKCCDKHLKRITQIKYHSTEINKLKRQPPNEHV